MRILYALWELEMIDLSVYGTLAVSRIGLQIGTSMLERRKQQHAIKLPPATLIVACYNEPIELLWKALRSFNRLDYPELEVIVVDDGSRNHEAVREMVEEFGFEYIHQNNAGKREAMYTAFQRMSPRSRIVFTADSDTIWHKNAAKELAIKLLQDEQTGAVTGEVAVLNANTNLLTRLIAIRYHIAFVHERASQSYFGSITCVSGPLGAYRREIIERIKEDFVGQTLFGKRCTYGDDRHLTNLVLNEGYQVRYASKAVCLTYAPEGFRQLVKQQTRWSKSYWREIIWQLRVLPKHGLYMTYDWIVSFMLPFLLLFTASHRIAEAFGGSWWHIAALAGTIVGMSLLRVAEPLIRTRRPVFLLFTIYSFMYFAVMLPSKIWALATINDGKWGTR